jgi:hypothetical protein
MYRLEEGLPLRTNGNAFNQREELRRLARDIADLKQRITHQVRLIQELAWEAQDAATPKEVLCEMQDTLKDWCAHRDLILKLQASEGDRPVW